MRGSITWDQVWELDNETIKNIQKLIKQNIENTKKTGMPIL